VILSTELFIIEPLHCFVIHTGNCVAVGEQLVSFSVIGKTQNRSFADAPALQELSTALHFRINFAPAESSQE